MTKNTPKVKIKNKQKLPISKKDTPNETGLLSSHLSSLFLSLYGALSVIATSYAMIFWAENWSSLTDQYFPLASPSYICHLSILILSIIAFVSLFLLTEHAKREKHKVLERLVKKPENLMEIKPIFFGLLNAAILGVIHMVILFILNGFTAFTIVFSVISVGIIGVSTFYMIAKSPIELLQSDDKNCEIEALKLVHQQNMTFSRDIIWASVLLIASVAFISWTQGIFPLIDEDLLSSTQANNLQVILVVQLAYLAFGVWFGLLSALWNQNWSICKKIAHYKEKK